MIWLKFFYKGDLVIKHIALMKRILFRELDMGCHLLEYPDSSQLRRTVTAQLTLFPEERSLAHSAILI